MVKEKEKRKAEKEKRKAEKEKKEGGEKNEFKQKVRLYNI